MEPLFTLFPFPRLNIGLAPFEDLLDTLVARASGEAPSQVVERRRRRASRALQLGGWKAGMRVLWVLVVCGVGSIELEVWSPAPGSVTEGRNVDLGFRTLLPEDLDVDACDMCVVMEGETLTCEPLSVMATEQMSMQDLLPGKRELTLVLFRTDRETGERVALVDATSTFTVGANEFGDVGVDLTAAKADDDPWRAAVPDFALGDERRARAAYFEAVYDLKYWSARGQMPGVPGSGPGSTLAAASNAIAVLESLVRELSVSRVLDVPCGDMTWMREADLGVADYVGADIVATVVQSNVDTLGHERRRFLVADVRGRGHKRVLHCHFNSCF